PVGYDETAEIHAIPEHAGQQAPVAGHLDALPARKADHHRRTARLDRGAVWQAVDVAQHLFGNLRVALVDAVVGPAVSQEVLGRGHDLATLEDAARVGRALQAAHHSADVGGDERRIGGITFVCA